jgi:nitrate/TMAO reductase-like tetraheme cytochrome c subunit
MEMSIFADPLTAVTLGAVVIAAALILYYLIRRPPLHAATKLILFAGLGLFPLLAAGSGNYAGFKATSTREFCGGCHTMGPWVDDAADPDSTTLSALHARNELFGEESCYACHADYGPFGVVATKINGLKHVLAYLTEYRSIPVEEAVETIRIYKPYPNSNCTHCHSTKLPGWRAVPDHKVTEDPEEVSCASSGCHGPVHPFAGGSHD